MRFPFVMLMILGGLGPALAEIILVFGRGSKRQKRDYWHRMFDFRRIGAGWFAVIFFMFPILNIIASLLSIWTGGSRPTFETAARLTTPVDCSLSALCLVIRVVA